MSVYIPTEHRFADEASFNAAMQTAGWDTSPNSLVAVHVMGVLPSRSEWHVNVSRQTGVIMPEAFALAQISPETPKTVWFGVERTGATIYVRDGVPLMNSGSVVTP